MNIIQKILGSANDRLVKSYDKTVSIINDLEPRYHAMSDEELRAQTEVLRNRLQSGEKVLEFFMFYRNIKSPNLFRQNREESPNLAGLRFIE